MVFCSDTFEYLSKINRLIKSEDAAKKMKLIERMSPVLAKVVTSVRRFVTNRTEGMMNPDFNVGETINSRQSKVFKQGITRKILRLLEIMKPPSEEESS